MLPSYSRLHINSARGLGLAIGVGCAELGATVALLDILDEPSEERALLEQGNKIKLHYYYVDVANYDSLSAAFEKIEQSLGPIDALVNNDGVGPQFPFLNYEKETIDRLLAIIVSKSCVDDMEMVWKLLIESQVAGTIYAYQIAARQMDKHGKGGSIVNISSIGGHAAAPNQTNSVYYTTKGAILGFTKSLVVEFTRSGIRVNSTCRALKALSELYPWVRFADRHELKSTVACLLTPAASYITGQDIAIDVGMLAA